MKVAVKGATKWLIEKATANKKLNPVPYALFKSILEKQIEWARQQRGRILDFEELASAAREELLKSGIYVMSGSRNKQEAEIEHEEKLLFSELDEKDMTEISPVLNLELTSDASFTMARLFDWLHSVFDKAVANKYSSLQVSVKAVTEAENV